MANADNARGFEPIGSVGGEAGLQSYSVDSANAKAIFRKDPITLEADGNVTQSAAGDGTAVAAVAMGFLDSNGITLKYLPALTAGTVLGIPVKNQTFATQSATGVTYAATDVNATADFVVNAGSTLTGESRFELGAAGAGNQVRILGLASVDGQTNEWGSDNVRVEVAFVEDAYSNNTSI